MHRILLICTLLFGRNVAAQQSDSSTWKPGQILSETSKNLGFGLRIVSREQVNPTGHWDGVGHFSFLYFRDRLLCQCSSGDYSIAPTGEYALFQDGPSGKLLLFNVSRESIKEIISTYIGSPQHFTWDAAKNVVTVTFYQGLKNGYKDAAPLSIQLP